MPLNLLNNIFKNKNIWGFTVSSKLKYEFNYLLSVFSSSYSIYYIIENKNKIVKLF